MSEQIYNVLILIVSLQIATGYKSLGDHDTISSDHK